MSSIEKAIERFKKTSKFGSDKLDIDFALADDGQSGANNPTENESQSNQALSFVDN